MRSNNCNFGNNAKSKQLNVTMMILFHFGVLVWIGGYIPPKPAVKNSLGGNAGVNKTHGTVATTPQFCVCRLLGTVLHGCMGAAPEGFGYVVAAGNNRPQFNWFKSLLSQAVSRTPRSRTCYGNIFIRTRSLWVGNRYC